jgi:NRPS condensation-like uncharacterized protein
MMTGQPQDVANETQQPKRERLFPIFLSDFDFFMHVENRPEHPMIYYSLIDCKGRLDRERFQAALVQALQRHPLLLSQIVTRKEGRLYWDVVPDRLPQIDWGPLDQPCHHPASELMDVNQEPGLRVWVREGAEDVRINLQFSHVACDGIGGYRFIGDLFCIYDALVAGNEPTLGPLDPTLLRMRGMRSLLNAPHSEGFKAGFSTVWTAARLLATPAAKIVTGGVKAPASFPAPDFGIVTATLDSDESKQLRKKAVEIGATGNDVLMAASLKAVVDWNRQHRRRALLP